MIENEHARLAREAKRAQADQLGIDAAFVGRMVDTFYARIRDDAVLGPIFAAHVADWSTHLDRMNRFWRSVLFNSGEFRGNPMAKHVALPELDRDQFERWLALFDATLRDLGSDDARDHVYGRARTIASSLLNAVLVHRNGMLKATDPL